MALSAYFTVSQVEEELKIAVGFFKDSPVTKPSLTKVNEIIADISTMIEGVASAAGYVVPITGEKALVIVRAVGLAGGAARIEDILWSEVGKPNEAPRAESRFKQFNDGLKLISGGLVLIDQSKVTSGSHRLPRSYQQQNPDAAGVAPKVTRDMSL